MSEARAASEPCPLPDQPVDAGRRRFEGGRRWCWWAILITARQLRPGHSTSRAATSRPCPYGRTELDGSIVAQWSGRYTLGTCIGILGRTESSETAAFRSCSDACLGRGMGSACAAKLHAAAVELSLASSLPCLSHCPAGSRGSRNRDDGPVRHGRDQRARSHGRHEQMAVPIAALRGAPARRCRSGSYRRAGRQTLSLARTGIPAPACRL
jgi:hypothetical protein